MKPRLWLCTAAPLLLAVQTALATNLVTEGGFESGILSWTSPRITLTLDPTAAYSGQAGMKAATGISSCSLGAIYTVDTSKFQKGTLYEFGARIRLATEAGVTSTRLVLGLIKNGADPVYLDGSAASSYAYPDRWTRLFGAYKADFAPTDVVKVCIGNNNDNKPFYVDEVFATPLTTTEIGYQPPAMLDYEQLIQADGNRLVMGSAKTPFKVLGVNVHSYNYGSDVPGAEDAITNFNWKNYDEASFQEIKAMGFNSVRLQMSYVFFEDNANPGVYKEEGWAWLDRNIQWAKKHNLRLLLDMHEPPGGTQLPNQLDLTAATKKRLEDLWVAIAQRYRNETAILGYDLINEPYIENWFTYAPTLINKVRAVDPDHLIYIEPSYHHNDLGKPGKFYPLPFKNIVYDVHFYDDFASGDNGTAPYARNVASFKAEFINEFEDFYEASTDSFPYPLNSGEYGVAYAKYAGGKNLGAEQWMKDLNAAMDYYGVGRHMFAYHEERFGLYRGWRRYPGEGTTLNVPMKAMIQEIHNVPVTPGTDTLPTSADFAPKTAVLRSTEVESDPLTVSGIDTPTPINVYSGTYSLNGGAYTSTAGTVKNGDTVKVKHTSSANYTTKVSSKVIIGGAVGYFTSTTEGVAPSVNITTTSVPQGTVGTAYSTTSSVSGGTAPYTWSLAAGSLPAGLTLGSDGKITGTPTTAGTFSFTLKVSDKNAATDTQAVSMTVVAQPVVLPPDITTTSLTAGTVGTAYSKTFSVSNGTAPYSWSVSSGSLPAGLSLSAAGVLSGTPTTAATSSFTVKVSDGKGLTDTQALSLVVNAAPPTTGNADMALTTFTATATSVNKGSAAGFNFVLKNNGNDLAKNARFVLPMPANTTWVSGAAECVASTTQVVCSFGDLAKGQSRNRYLYLRPAVAGSLTVTGSVTSDTGDSITTNNGKTVTLTVN